MAENKIQTYPDVLNYLNKQHRQKHLLLGNGFSMAYNSEIFSYNALNRFIDNLENDLLRKVFNIINTKNFELVMQQLDNFSEIAKAFGTDENLVKQINEASETLKNSLIDAIQELHPEHVFKIPEEKSQSCAEFLNDFISDNGNVFTTNYDLLLYWVLMRNHIKNCIDGFGRDREDEDVYRPGGDYEYSELRWGKYKSSQNIHYLHGALPLFDKGIDIVKEEYDNGVFLLQKIKNRLENKDYPIFVTAGYGNEKLTHILHNQYLTHCYEELSSINGSLITFGFNFGEYDEHIIDAINVAAKMGRKSGEKLFSVYIGVYSEADIKHINRIKNKFKCKVNLYDAKSANIWNRN